MQYQIKRKIAGVETVIKTVTPTGTQQREAMGVDLVDMAFALASYTEFNLGDYVTVYGQVYKLNTPAVVDHDKLNSNQFNYNLQFEAEFYDLAKVQLQMLNPQNALLEPIFDLTGNAATVIGLIVENALRYSAGWTVGVVDDTDYQTFSFSAQNCLQALNELSSRFNTEFWIDNKTIHLQKREQASGLIFEVGKGKGLYTISRKQKENAKLLTRLYVRGGSTNIPAGYGSGSLLLPNGETYIQDDAKVDPALGGELIEASIVFAEIFPTRTGTISGVVASGGIGDPADENWKYFFDAAIDFDINAHKAPGLDVKVHFVSGDLAGYTFTIAEYDHVTKRLTINKNEEETALDLPNHTLRPKIGDKYRLIDLILPTPYVTDAENRVLAAGQEYYNLNSNIGNLYAYTAAVDSFFIKANAVAVVLGNTATLRDAAMAFEIELRMARYTRNLQNAYDYPEVVWADKLTRNEIIRQYQQQQKTLLLLESSGLLDVNQLRKSLFLNRLSERDGYLMLGSLKVKAGVADYAANAGHALLASEAINADLWDAQQFADYLNQPVRTSDDVQFKSLKSPSFVSGAFGAGFRIDEDGNAEFDNLSVRKSFQATEFIIQKIRASNGAIAVTDAATLESAVSSLPGTFFIRVNETIPFAGGDILRCQVFTGTGVKNYTVTVIDFDDGGMFVSAADATPFAIGDTLVRIGNVSDTDRQGLLYLTNGDSGAPYLDVIDGVNTSSFAGKTKVRLGKLDGIVDPDLGTLSGYGLFGQNVYVKGKIHVTGGNAETLTGATTKANAAQAAAISAAAADATTKAASAQTAAQTYAAAQAALEREVAKAHADGIVSDEEAARIADATAKLNEAKADATTKANAAQSAAISAAAADATSKSTAAQAAAISSAAADATAKANAAEANAQALVNAVKVGGRNLLLNYRGAPSSFFENYTDAQKGVVFKSTSQPTYWHPKFSRKLDGGEVVTFSIMCRMLAGTSPVSVYFNAANGYVNIGTATTNWQLLTVTRIITNGVDDGDILHLTGSFSDGLVYEYVKLEVGTKATDGSPAPEDVDAAISAANAAALAAQAANATLTANLKAMAYKDVVELAELGTTVISGGKIKTTLLDADYIKASIVNAIYVNTLELNASVIKSGTIDSARINASQIIVNGGGATQAYADTKANAAQAAAATLSQQLIDGLKIDGKNLLKNSKQTVSGTGMFLQIPIAEPLEPGQTYTASMNGIKGAGTSFDLWGSAGYERLVGFEAANGLQTISRTFVYGGAAGNHSTIYVYSENSLNPSTFYWAKIEKGNKATDWTPAPEDVQTAIDLAKSTADAANASYTALTANLKSLAYADVVELAKLGTTIIEGGKIKTTLLDADYIRANIVNAAHINTLAIVAKTLAADAGTIGAWTINSIGIKDEAGGAYLYSKKTFTEGGEVVATVGGINSAGATPDVSIGSELVGMSLINTRVTANKLNTALYLKAKGSGIRNLALHAVGNVQVEDGVLSVVGDTILNVNGFFLTNGTDTYQITMGYEGSTPVLRYDLV